MSWASLDPLTREAAERVLTDKQLHVFKLKASGYGYRRMADVLGVDPATARGHYRAAERKVMQELDRTEKAA